MIIGSQSNGFPTTQWKISISLSLFPEKSVAYFKISLYFSQCISSGTLLFDCLTILDICFDDIKIIRFLPNNLLLNN